jgi:hypothetical protein
MLREGGWLKMGGWAEARRLFFNILRRLRHLTVALCIFYFKQNIVWEAHRSNITVKLQRAKVI